MWGWRFRQQGVRHIVSNKRNKGDKDFSSPRGDCWTGMPNTWTPTHALSVESRQPVTVSAAVVKLKCRRDRNYFMLSHWFWEKWLHAHTITAATRITQTYFIEHGYWRPNSRLKSLHCVQTLCSCVSYRIEGSALLNFWGKHIHTLLSDFYNLTL